jgi:hypothetical protein
MTVQRIEGTGNPGIFLPPLFPFRAETGILLSTASRAREKYEKKSPPFWKIPRDSLY